MSSTGLSGDPRTTLFATLSLTTLLERLPSQQSDCEPVWDAIR
nr:MAG TPA: hypothetical protein [Caudoviricetes sp.]